MRCATMKEQSRRALLFDLPPAARDGHMASVLIALRTSTRGFTREVVQAFMKSVKRCLLAEADAGSASCHLSVLSTFDYVVSRAGRRGMASHRPRAKV